MRLRNVRGSREKIAADDHVIKEPEKLKGFWTKIIGSPIHLEVGMGKGKFLTELARLNPQIEYIGIEKFSNVLVRAVEKMEEESLPNIHFLRMDAEYIENVFEQGEVSRIYLNFSDPWPKERHIKRRLTSPRYLERYRNILSDDGEVIFKTDNQELFDFSLVSIQESGWELLAVTRDLHHSKYLEGNVMTEYEERFAGQGKPICMLKTRPIREPNQEESDETGRDRS